MHKCIIKPRISEVNGSGHVSNTVYPVWLEEGRVELLKEALHGKQFPNMLACLEQNFQKEVFYGSSVIVKSNIKKIGNSSLTIKQEVWQNDSLCADAKSVLVHIDRESKRPSAISDEIRSLLTGKIELE
ncbi:MAG: acyl-CoA thioesterase [Proteobacteria bacterium]|nr:acyl-CoA thioesterase [Pseudomonadota bacterium]